MKVFLSSTYIDLKEYRDAVNRATDLLGHDLISWEQQFAFGEPIVESIEKNIDSADIIVFIIGDRIGSAFSEDGKSALEFEYDLILKKEKPILFFIRNLEDPPPNQRLIEFKNKIMSEKLVTFFSSPKELEQSLIVALSKYANIVKSLQNPKFDWRTIKGLSKEVQLKEEEVSGIVEQLPGVVIRSSVPDKKGQALYTTRDHYRETASNLSRLVNWLSI